jgi:hypothetical protein
MSLVTQGVEDDAIFLARIPVCPTAGCTAPADVLFVRQGGRRATRFECTEGHVSGGTVEGSPPPRAMREPEPPSEAKPSPMPSGLARPRRRLRTQVTPKPR